MQKCSTFLVHMAVAAIWLTTALLTFDNAQAQARGAFSRGDAARGAALYERRCTSCHALDVNRIGPLHRGVVGRRAGSVPGFNYSPALARSGLVWTEANLDRWLSGPPRLVPGTRMGISVPVPAERADIIAYLRSQGAARR